MPLLVPPTSSLRALPPYVFAELDRVKAAARARGLQFTDLGIGSPDAPTSPAIIDALTAAAHDTNGHGYPPFRGTTRFLEAAARFMHARFGVPVDPVKQVLALSGSKEGLAQVMMAYCGPGDVALVPDIFYPVHARAPLLNGAEVYYLPMRAENGFLPKLDPAAPDIPADVLRRAKVLLINYPNNPTGAVATHAFYQQAVAFARKHNLVLVSDLAYSELTYDGYVAPSILEVDGAGECAVEFHSCSKSFNMAGFRLGFCVGNPDIIETIAAYRTNIGYGTPPAIQAAGAYAFDHYRELGAQSRDRYRERRDAVASAFREIGWHIDPPKAAMYIWLPIPHGYTDWEWTHALLNHANVVVTPGLTFGPGGAGYFRISLVADQETLTAAIRRIPSAVQAGLP